MALKLWKYLVLNRYFLRCLGFDNFNDLRERLKETKEGYDDDGKSYFIDTIICFKNLRIPEDKLIFYDKEIKKYVIKLRQNRRQPDFNLKYFQYLAVLFTEIFLDKYYNERDKFLKELNEELKKFNSKSKRKISPFTEKDLRKLAFWMATGSGKTIIMHINYWQILKYSNRWDNIILITPNEGLSRQHYEEMKLSGIPCKLYDGNLDNLKTRKNEVLIIDIHKLTEEKVGRGVRVDISFFDGKNLVFIDEGHKGQKSEEQKWKKLREDLGKDGFIFEYSAVFGQVIDENSKDLLNEYAKSIIFDYSYKYFYIDGYGKDFYVFNLREDAYTKSRIDLLLIAALLTYFEQLYIYDEFKNHFEEYNIERPLWIFVGSTVIKKKNGRITQAEIKTASDVERVIIFLNKILSDRKYLEENIEKILNGKSGLVNKNGEDIFSKKFEFLRKKLGDVNLIVDEIYKRIFDKSGELKLRIIKSAEGEIGLKTSGGRYFGVINIGDVNEFKKLIKDLDIELEEDRFEESLFFKINEKNSPISILIGSKKFIEGWNSWRVSNMVLINIGRGEGPQIIQLFGRGVRLKGRNNSLKREENPTYELKTLQTLYIFGLNANYMDAFLRAIEREEVEYEEIEIPIRFNIPEKWENKIYIIKTRDDFNFLDHPIKLKIDDAILTSLKIDIRPKFTYIENLKSYKPVSSEPIEIPKEYLDVIDWNSVYLNIMNYKIEKGFYNLIIDRNVLKKIVLKKRYIYALKDQIKIQTFEDILRLRHLVEMIIKKYIDKFYRKQEKKKTMDYLIVKPLDRSYTHVYPEGYKIILKIPKSLLEDFKSLINQLEEYTNSNKLIDIYRHDIDYIPTIHFDRHLYTPLMVYKKGREDIKSIPVKLNEGETRFVKDLRTFLKINHSILRNIDVFLLRNLSRRGVGFFISSGFYPDFIMWVKKDDNQKIVFIDPKGIRNTGNFSDDKIQFCASYIKEIESTIREQLKEWDKKINIELYAFIISVTKFDAIKSKFGEGKYSQKEFEAHNIIFQEKGYIKKIFQKIGLDIL